MYFEGMHAAAKSTRAAVNEATPTTTTPPAPASETKLITTPESLPPTMSMQLWDLDWTKELPRTYGNGTTVIHPARWPDGAAFMKEHYARIFGTSAEGRFLVEEMTEAKRRYCMAMDVFLMKVDGETVAMAACSPGDWSTYYVRMLAIVPQFRDKRVGCEFTTMLTETLPKYGLARFEADCSAANKACIKLCLTSGMIPTSTSNSERWGMSIRFTRFLRQDAEEIFSRQFLHKPM